MQPLIVAAASGGAAVAANVAAVAGAATATVAAAEAVASAAAGAAVAAVEVAFTDLPQCTRNGQAEYAVALLGCQRVASPGLTTRSDNSSYI